MQSAHELLTSCDFVQDASRDYYLTNVHSCFPPSKWYKGRGVLTPNAVGCIEIAKTFKRSIYIAEISNRLEDYTNVFLDQISDLEVSEFPAFFRRDKCSKTAKTTRYGNAPIGTSAFENSPSASKIKYH